ncbi:hypothetical protein M3Y94_01082600 [Aphelenchoides besseyi]|nr:hypothetical protein M3Y94_01082600 [Aphelenchoides besseyi]KAI6218808.1 hypothetical protein M3Y95_01155000 [Aphelenchoides besseyi]
MGRREPRCFCCIRVHIATWIIAVYTFVSSLYTGLIPLCQQLTVETEPTYLDTLIYVIVDSHIFSTCFVSLLLIYGNEKRSSVWYLPYIAHTSFIMILNMTIRFFSWAYEASVDVVDWINRTSKIPRLPTINDTLHHHLQSLTNQTIVNEQTEMILVLSVPILIGLLVVYSLQFYVFLIVYRDYKFVRSNQTKQKQNDDWKHKSKRSFESLKLRNEQLSLRFVFSFTTSFISVATTLIVSIRLFS